VRSSGGFIPPAATQTLVMRKWSFDSKVRA
jgi:hypothetical protein